MSARAPRPLRQLIEPDQRAWLQDSTEALGDDDVCVWLAEPASWRAPEDRQRLLMLLSEEERALVACAVVGGRPVGVDVEDASRPAPLEIAERYFVPGERRDIFATDPDQRTRRFFEYWTLKEAYVKACGLGLSLPLDRFEFQRDTEGAWRIAFAPPALDDPAAWWFHAWPTPTHQAAVALRIG